MEQNKNWWVELHDTIEPQWTKTKMQKLERWVGEPISLSKSKYSQLVVEDGITMMVRILVEYLQRVEVGYGALHLAIFGRNEHIVGTEVAVVEAATAFP